MFAALVSRGYWYVAGPVATWSDGDTTMAVLRACLAADATVTALVGTRIYPLVMPQDATRPAIVLTVVSEVPENSFDGTAETRLTASRVQVDCYAATYLEAHEVATAVDNVLANLRRPDLSAERDSMTDDWDDEVQVHRVSMDFSVWR